MAKTTQQILQALNGLKQGQCGSTLIALDNAIKRIGEIALKQEKISKITALMQEGTPYTSAQLTELYNAEYNENVPQCDIVGNLMSAENNGIIHCHRFRSGPNAWYIGTPTFRNARVVSMVMYD